MEAMTITEALAEIKTIGKRLSKKRAFVNEHLFRQEKHRDPFEKDGGSEEVVRREMQAIDDLEERIIRLRSAIAEANAEHELTIGKTTRTIADWLVWRREVATLQTNFISQLQNTISAVRSEARKRGVNINYEDKGQASDDVILNVSDAALHEESENLTTILGTLDGRLSHANATTVIHV